MQKKVLILFKNDKKSVEISAAHGKIGKTEKISDKKYAVTVEDAQVGFGPYQTRVTVRTEDKGFSFFLRDVKKEAPVFIEIYGAIITEATDKRSYEKIAEDIDSVGGKSHIEQMESEEETSFDKCIKGNRELKSPTWLGISRDIRFFEIGIRDYCGEMWDCVLPRTFADGVVNKEIGEGSTRFGFMAGRGIGIRSNQVRRLEEGVLPILNATSTDDEIEYKTQYFVTNEFSPLDQRHVKGTEMLVADAHGAGHMFTPEQQKEADKLIEKDNKRKEETVLYIKITAKNTAKFPKNSYVYLPNPGADRWYAGVGPDGPHYHPENGYGMTKSGDVYMICTLNGKPVPSNEMCVLLQAGEEIEYVFKIPHSAIPKERADALAKEDYAVRFAQCKKFWHRKYSNFAKIHVPEKRIDEMIRAGYGHIDTVYFGKEPNGAVVPCIGVYTGIGSESSSAIQFLDSVGNHKLAERAIQFFMDKQHEDGLVMNFGGYMLETGYILWTIGEHYRYTRDKEWVKRIRKNIIAAADYNKRWREQFLDENLRKKGYGMIAGRVADPEDPFHSYMLNAGVYGGFVGAADALADIDPEHSKEYRNLAAEVKANMEESFEETLIEAPVYPLQNGRWMPSVAPWTGYPGSTSMYAEGGNWYSHGTIQARDMTGPQYAFHLNVFDTHGEWGEIVENYYSEYASQKNVIFSQPYYSTHPKMNLLRGNVKSFISEFYNNMSGLADRTTYSFWEHYWHASPHKLHEEGWFLQRCRWMLWLEDEKDLKLLAGIPREWMKQGKYISYENVKSRFGTISLKAKSDIRNGVIKAHVKFTSNGEEPLPERIMVRLPNPVEGVKAVSANIGKYCSKCESVIIENIKANTEFDIELKF